MPRKDQIKYFPFSPGIPWKLKNGRYVKPEINQQIWDSVLPEKSFVVLAHGGLLETFCSLSIVEALGKLEPNKRLFWAGNHDFESLVWAQGIARNLDVPNICEQYPVPLFFDRENKAYFNCLNNYITVKSYCGTYEYPNNKLIFQQIFQNAMIPWDHHYVPKLRQERVFEKYTNWCKSVGLKNNQRFITIFAEKTFYSRHAFSCLGWKPLQVRELTAMVRKFGLPVVVCSDNDGVYYNSPVIRAPIDIDIIIPLLNNAWMILSEQIDFLLMALCLSNAHIITKPQEKKFDLYRHADFLHANNVISTTDDLAPIEVYTIIEGMYG